MRPRYVTTLGPQATITSEQVVYRAAKKVYSDEVLHVFRSFRRTGSSNLNGTERQEQYEVVLEDWLVENLNQRYFVPEDFNAYKQLTRPTAKGIFGSRTSTDRLLPVLPSTTAIRCEMGKHEAPSIPVGR
jgi:hypothetical protein